MKKKRVVLKGHEFVNEVMSDDVIPHMCDRFIDHMDTAFEKWTPRKRFTMFKA